MNHNELAVVVPVYKNILNRFEIISLIQIFKVFGEKNDIYFLAPSNLSFDEYEELKGRNYYIKRFSDKFFIDRASYSKLMLWPDFYLAFKEYDYILIHQLDAFTFGGDLNCYFDNGIDYVGAPLIGHDFYEFNVGNGGYSLRNVESCYRLTLKKDELIGNHHKKSIMEAFEDGFFSYCGTLPDAGFKVADVETALHFSVQSNCFFGMDRFKDGRLPYGTHHFPLWNYHYWRPVIEKLGYELPPQEDVQSIDTFSYDEKATSEEIFFRYLAEKASRGENVIASYGLYKTRSIALWGAGEWGYRIKRFLGIFGYSVIKIFDKNPDKSCIYSMDVCLPNYNEMYSYANKYPIQIASTLYDKEMSENLEKVGLIMNEHFFSFSEFEGIWKKEWEKFERKNIRYKLWDAENRI